uniref:RING-type domain-containing protein n=1 Tax=Globodera rostochiensis TaxID=31243 RepID=A0A914HHY2_GLORO
MHLNLNNAGNLLGFIQPSLVIENLFDPICFTMVFRISPAMRGITLRVKCRCVNNYLLAWKSKFDKLLQLIRTSASDATNAQIQLVNQAKSSDPNERLAAVSRIGLLLWNGANLDEVAIAEFVSIGAVPVLVNCLESTDDRLLVAAAWTLMNITNVKAREVFEAGAVPPFVKLLQSEDMEVCVCTAMALANITAASDDRALAVIEAGALPPLVKLLQSENMELCKQIAWALTNITDASDDLALAVVEAGALPLLVKLLQSPDMDLCESTAWTLKNIAAASDDLALAVIEAGALPPLVELLQSQNQEANDEEITFKVLNGIKKVLNNAQNRREKVIELIEKSGGLQKIEQLKTKESEFILKMIEKLQLTKGCVVCFDKKIDFVFIPCWHACVCEECAENIGICPMCRQIISHKQRIYLPLFACSSTNTDTDVSVPPFQCRHFSASYKSDISVPNKIKAVNGEILRT